jgi:type I restriction enzyme S subunit
MSESSSIPAWKRGSLLSFADYHNGAAFNPSHWGEDGIPIIRIEQINDPSAPTDFYDGPLLPQNAVTTGDLIFSWSATLKAVIWRNGDGALNQHLFKVVPKNGTNKAFFKYVLEQNMESISSGAQGSTMKHITRGELQRYHVEVPEQEAEQRRIAEILSTLDEAIEQTEALIAKHQQIKAGLMHDLFTRGVTPDGHLRPTREQAPDLYKESPLGWIPKEWEVRPFHSVLAGNLQNGYFKKPEFVGTGYKLVNVSELYQPFGIDTDHPNVERVAATSTDFQKFGVQEGDLFFTRSSLVLSGIAQCNTVLKLIEPTLFECHVIRSQPDKNIVNPEFLGLYFQTPWARRELMSRAKQTTMTTISQPDIVSVPVLRPPLDEQTSIAHRITCNMMSIHAEGAYLTKLRQQKHGLMHDLLTGHVQVKV